MVRPLHIGVQLPEVERRVPWPELLSMARTAEAVGLDSIWVGDHLLYELPDGSVRGPWEVWTSLAAFAAATERIALGPLVASLGFHDAAMLAKMIATVDGVSGGRLIVGVGAGWNEREYRAFGLPFDRRVDRFDEAFQVLRRLLAGETVTHAGEFAQYDRCAIDPPPAWPGAPPLMVGSIGQRMLGITLPHVWGWNVWWSQFGNTPEGFAEVAATVAERAVHAGRDPSTLVATAAVYVQAPGGLGRNMGDPADEGVGPVTGTPAQVAETFAAFADAGAHHLQLVVDPITVASIEWLGDVLSVLDDAAN